MQTESLMLSGTGNIALVDYTLTSVTGYSWFNANIVNGFDQTIPGGGGAATNNSVYNSFPERFDQFSHELRILSPTGRTFEFIAGAYYDRWNYRLDQFQGFNIEELFGSPYFGRLDRKSTRLNSSHSCAPRMP